MISDDYKKALDLFNQKEYTQAAKLFDKLDLKYESGYCEFAKTDFEKAKYIWEHSNIDSPAVNWGFCALNLVNLIIPIKMSYFQIRNFLERDIAVLLEGEHMNYVENIISAEKVLFKFNPESYKFIGRVLVNEGYLDVGYDFLLKARDVCYTDPEVHFLIAEYFLFLLDRETAARVLEDSLKINPDYYPAKSLLEQTLCDPAD